MAKKKAEAPDKPDKAARTAAKAARKHERQVVKVEAQLADALEVRVALDALILTLEERLRELRGQPAATAAPPAVAKASAPRARTRATGTGARRTVRSSPTTRRAPSTPSTRRPRRQPPATPS
jgi:hypothetical protein